MSKPQSRRAGTASAPWPSHTRLLVAGVAGFALAAAAAAFSLALVVQRSQPLLALALVPLLPKAAARAADLELAKAGSAGPKGARAQRIRQFAREVLEASPLSSAGLRQLAQLERDPARRQALYDLAIEVTRRDPIALIQASEYYLRTNRLDPALHNFDRALRVSSDTDPMVFAALLSTTGDPQVRAKLRNLVARNPVWSERLVQWSLQNPASLQGLSRIVGALPKGAVALDPGYGQGIIDQLAVQRQYAEAFAVYAAYARSQPNPANFAAGKFRPIDWSLNDNYESGARPLGGADDGVELFAESSRVGEAARLLVQSRPGARSLVLRANEVEGQGGAVGLDVVCLQGPSERRLATLTSPLRAGVMRFTYSVPASDCPYHWLRLSIGAGDVAARAVVERVELGPAA